MSVKNCELCAQRGLKSDIRWYKINFEESVLLCSRNSCPYPFGVAEIIVAKRDEQPSIEKIFKSSEYCKLQINKTQVSSESSAPDDGCNSIFDGSNFSPDKIESSNFSFDIDRELPDSELNVKCSQIGMAKVNSLVKSIGQISKARERSNSVKIEDPNMIKSMKLLSTMITLRQCKRSNRRIAAPNKPKTVEKTWESALSEQKLHKSKSTDDPAENAPELKIERPQNWDTIKIDLASSTDSGFKEHTVFDKFPWHEEDFDPNIEINEAFIDSLLS